MKRKALLISLAVALVAMMALGVTLAYFTAEDNATNTFTVGNVDIELVEPLWTSSGSNDAPQVYPGEPLAKDPTVNNIGANPCFVRVKVEGLDCLKSYCKEGTAEADALIKLRSNYVVGALGENWVDGGDGYYYYTKVLMGNADGNTAESTTPLFDSIVIPTALEGLPENITNSFDVVVSAQAVQAQGAKPSFAAVQVMTLAEIQAWFTTCGL